MGKGCGKKGGKAKGAGLKGPPAHGWGAGFNDSTEAGFCSTHGKKRTQNNLMDDGAGGMCCAPGFECKGSGEGGTGVAQTIAQGGMLPGDWMCPSCGDHQFARNMVCKMCGGPKSMDG